jgi:hypothetical protein
MAALEGMATFIIAHLLVLAAKAVMAETRVL